VASDNAEFQQTEFEVLMFMNFVLLMLIMASLGSNGCG